MTDPQAVAAPRTRRGQFLLEELPGLIRGGWTPFREEQWTGTILAIEAEARQQMKAETRERIFRDNGLIADPLAAASPAAPAVDAVLRAYAIFKRDSDHTDAVKVDRAYDGLFKALDRLQDQQPIPASSEGRDSE